MSDDEDDLCPLCVEEMDLSDKYFKPCPCGYQICRFCWHYIKENGNGLCPACRRAYTDEDVQFRPVTAEDMGRLKAEKNAKKRAKKEKTPLDKKHLANMRVVQKNLVYISGLNSKVLNEETLRSNDYLGQFGKILKIVFQKKQQGQPLVPLNQSNTSGVFVTFALKADAAKAIVGLDATVLDGRMLRANYGTTKYCQTYLRNQTCTNAACMYLHEPGEDADSFSKDELVAARQQFRPNEGKAINWQPLDNPDDTEEGSALPPTASWATKPVMQPSRNGPSSPAVFVPGEPTEHPTPTAKVTSWEAHEGEESQSISDSSLVTGDGTEPTPASDLVVAKRREEKSDQLVPSGRLCSPTVQNKPAGTPKHPPSAPRTEALGIALPFPYLAEQPSSLDPHLRDDYFMLPSSGLDGFRGDLESTRNVSTEQASPYRGTFNPFGDTQPAPIPPPVPSLGFRLRSSEFAGFGVELPRKLPYGKATMRSHPESHSRFDPFRDDILPIAACPPSMAPMEDGSSRLPRPPGLFEREQLVGPWSQTAVVRGMCPSSSDEVPASVPRRRSRFGFAQDAEYRSASAGAGPPIRAAVTHQGLPQPGNKQEGCNPLLPHVSTNFGLNTGTRAKLADFENGRWSTTSSMPEDLTSGAALGYDVFHASPTVANGAAWGVNVAIADHSRQGFQTGQPSTSAPPTSNAQDFLGAFLKAAQQHPQSLEIQTGQIRNGFFPGDVQNAVASGESELHTQTPFQDPAIMLIGRRSSAHTTSAMQAPAVPLFPANDKSNIPGRYRLPIFQNVGQGGQAEQGIDATIREARQRPSGGSTATKQRQEVLSKGTIGSEKGDKRKIDTAGVECRAKLIQESKGSSQHLQAQQSQQLHQHQQRQPQKAQSQTPQILVSERKHRKGKAAEKEAVTAGGIDHQAAPLRAPSDFGAAHDTKTLGGEPAVAVRSAADRCALKKPSSASKAKPESEHLSSTDAGDLVNHEQPTKSARRISASPHGSSALQPAQQSAGGRKQRIRQQLQTRQKCMDEQSPKKAQPAGALALKANENQATANHIEAMKGGADITSSSVAASMQHTVGTSSRKDAKQMARKAEGPSVSSIPSGRADKVAPAPVQLTKTAANGATGSIRSVINDRTPGILYTTNLSDSENFPSHRFGLNSAKLDPSGGGMDDLASSFRRLPGAVDAGDGAKNAASSFASAADDVATLERKVIEARREAALLENQLNAVIKKNRTYTGKI